MKNLAYAAILSLLLAVIECSNSNGTRQPLEALSPDEAADFIKRYTLALTSGDSTQVRRFFDILCSNGKNQAEILSRYDVEKELHPMYRWSQLRRSQTSSRL